MSRNTITYVGSQVQKRYLSRISHDNELLLLTILAQTGLVPVMTSQTGDSITLAHVEGSTLLERLEEVWAGRATPEDGRRLLGALADWLCAAQRYFISKTGRAVALEDPNLRNFLVKPGGELVGLDFEYWHYGAPEETPAMLLAYLGSYRGTRSPTAVEDCRRLRSELTQRLSLDESKLLRTEECFRNRLFRRRTTAALRGDSTAVLLVGGRSERMGRPKAELMAGGYTFLDRALHTLSSFDHVAVSAAQAYQTAALAPVWIDRQPGLGPMGGLLTALSRAETPLVFLMACDTPDITEELICHIYSALAPEDDCLVPVADGRIQPLLGVYRTALLPRVDALVQSGDYRMRALLDSVSTHYLPLVPVLCAQTMNINTPQEYAAWQARQPRI